jgi:cytoskeletal protein RodZ
MTRQRALGVGAIVAVAILVVMYLVFRDGGASAPEQGAQSSGTGTSQSAGPAVSSAPSKGSSTPAAGSSTSLPSVIGTPTSPPPGTPTNPTVTTTGPVPSDPTDQIPPEATPVAPTATATGADGVAVSVAKVESVDGKAVAPGEISGPAVRLTLRVQNTSGATVDLNNTVVNAYVGAERVPAPTLVEPGGRPFSGSVAPKKSSDGVYLFLIPTASRGDVTVTLDYAASERTLVFRGALT